MQYFFHCAYLFHDMLFLFYLLFGLCLLHHLSAHFNSRGEDGTGEVRHIDALQVTNLLGRWGRELQIFCYTDRNNCILDCEFGKS